MKSWLAAAAMAGALGSCAAGLAGPERPGNGDLEQLWREPTDLASRDLFYGAGGAALAPRPDARYQLEDRDTAGFSITYDVRDERGQEWSVKIGPEAQTEVVSSRLVWAVGYHQPPAYYVRRWTYQGADTAPVHGRFRPKLRTLKQAGVWDWNENPFKGTRPLNGLKVLMAILNSTDLKDLNNAIYEADRSINGVTRWFVAKDLGATLGETGAVNPRRGWIEGFEKHGFIREVEDGKVKFEFHGRHGDVFDDLTPADVAWICDRLARLSTTQWSDAFRAGGYDEPIAARYIARIQEKVRQGKTLVTTWR